MKRITPIFALVVSLTLLFSSGCSRSNQDTEHEDNDREESVSVSKNNDSKTQSNGKINFGSLFGKKETADETETQAAETAVPIETETNEAQNAETTAEAAQPAQTSEPDSSQSAYILPFSDTKLLSYEDIAHLAIEDIPYARNEIYARHGYSFQKESYIQYFGSKDWYSINPDFKESDLSEIEKKNVEFLKGYEQR